MAYQSSYIPTVNTQLYYKLNGGATDDSGNGNNGTATNVTYVDGRFGQGASFNGASSYIQASNNSTLKPSSSATKTISLWFKNTTSYPVYGMLWNGGYDNGNAPDSSGFIALNSTNVIRLTGNGTNVVDATFTHTTGAWTHLTCVMGSTGKIYINGLLRASGSLTFNGGVSSREPQLGVILYGTSAPIYHFNGQIDEFFTQDGELTTKEIQQYYTNAIGRYQTTII